MKRSVPLLFIALLHIHCYSTQSVFDKQTQDMNGVHRYENPQYSTSLNWFGWTIVTGVTIGSAWAGYESNIALEWETEKGKEIKPVGNAILAGCTGGLTSLILAGIFRPSNPKMTDDNAENWVRNLDNKLIFLNYSTDRPRSVLAIHDSAEQKFSPNSPEDLQLFAQAFPGSRYTEQVASRGVERFPRKDLPIVIRIFPETKAAETAKQRFFDEAPNLNALIEAAKRYPELSSYAESQAIHHITSFSEARNFNTTFPNSSHLKDIVRNIAPNVRDTDLESMLREFTGDSVHYIVGQEALKRARSVSAAANIGTIVPALSEQAEKQALFLAKAPEGYRQYLAAYPESPSATRIRDLLREALTTPENLGKSINSSASEYSPVISPDGRTLYFTRRYTSQNQGSYDDDDIWYSTLNHEGDWNIARNLKELNNSSPNSVNAVTPDGNTLLLHGEYTRYKWTTAASLTNKTSESWSTPEPLRIQGYKNYGQYMQSFLANDGKTLLLAIENSESLGQHDIFVCFLQQDGSWSKPRNLGPDINSSKADDTPFIASDNRTLYFSSDGHGGYGGKDLFMARRLDDSWTKWSHPINLESPINTEEDDDFFFIPASGDLAYFASDRSGLGNSDLFRVALPDKMQPLPVVLIVGKVFEANTNVPLAARVIYEDLVTGKEIGVARTDPATGEYKITLPPGHLYGFRAEAENYIAVSDNLDLSELKIYREQQRDLALVPLEVGKTVRLNNLFFDLGKSSLRPESFPELERLAALLQHRQSMEIEIQGHTDSLGTEENNIKLSKDRAESVAHFLQSKGVSTSRLKTFGYGESQPLRSNDTEAGRQFNRRVEFFIKKE